MATVTGSAMLLLGATLVTTTRYWRQSVSTVLGGRRDGDSLRTPPGGDQPLGRRK